MELIKSTYYRDWMKELRGDVVPPYTPVVVTIYKGKTYHSVEVFGKLKLINRDISIDLPISDYYDIQYTVVNETDETIYYRIGENLYPVYPKSYDKAVNIITISFDSIDPHYQSVTFVPVTVGTNGGLEKINFGTVAYDTNKICQVFNTYYRNWFINNPYDDDFRESLQECYDLNREKIDRFYDHITNLNTKSNTVMTVEYDERTLTSNDYQYPITGSPDDSSPSSANKSNESAKTDTTTVERDDDPIKTVNDVENLRTFNQMFIDCFKPCFTLFESLTW